MFKRCYKCGISKLLDQFSKNKAKKDGLSSQCRSCHSIMRRKHYEKNREKIIKQTYKKKKEIMQLIREYKTNKACMDCGVIYPYYVLDFDHRYDKKFGICHAFKTAGKKQILAEIEKCDLVCANCHRIRTHSHRERV